MLISFLHNDMTTAAAAAAVAAVGVGVHNQTQRSDEESGPTTRQKRKKARYFDRMPLHGDENTMDHLHFPRRGACLALLLAHSFDWTVNP